MAISSVGLSPSEVDSIMRDIAGQPGAITPGANTNSTVTTSSAPPVSSNKVSNMLPPALAVNPVTGKMEAPKPPRSPYAAMAVGATTGLIVGGPLGAAAGAGGMWLLSKFIK